jgi:uncharacterized membrane protein
MRRGLISPERQRIFRFWLPLRVVRGHPRLFTGIAVSLLAGVVLPGSFRLATRLLIAWNAGTWLYFIASGGMIARATPQSIQRRARMSDEGRFFILVLTRSETPAHSVKDEWKPAAPEMAPDSDFHLSHQKHKLPIINFRSP